MVKREELFISCKSLLSAPSQRFREIFTLDIRTLSLFRVLLSCLILFDLFQRGRYLESHYADFGVLPRSELLTHFSSPFYFSIHLISGSYWWQLSLFIINSVFAIMLMGGYRTRIATFVCWFLMISLHNRNTLVLQGGDVLFRMLLFWGFFLPLGAYASIDNYIITRKLRSGSQKCFEVFSGASIALVLQFVILYVIAASHKIALNWTQEFTGVYQALSADHFATPIGVWLRELRWPLPYLTQMTLYLEWSIPFIIICPFFSRYCRIVAVALTVGLHAGFASSLAVGLFWIIDIVGMLALLPSLFWEHLTDMFPRYSLQDRLYCFFDRVRHEWIPRLPRLEPAWRQRLGLTLVNSFVLSCLVYIGFWVTPYLPNSEFSFPQKHGWFGVLLGFDQRWQMFSPKPMSNDGWFVVEGVLRDGSTADVLTGIEGEVSYEMPENLSQTFVTQRWRKYFRNLIRHTEKPALLNYGKALCRSWNRDEKRSEKKLESFEIYYMEDTTLPNYEKAPVKKHLRWKHFCFEVPPEYKNKAKDTAKTAK